SPVRRRVNADCIVADLMFDGRSITWLRLLCTYNRWICAAASVYRIRRRIRRGSAADHVQRSACSATVALPFMRDCQAEVYDDRDGEWAVWGRQVDGCAG